MFVHKFLFIRYNKFDTMNFCCRVIKRNHWHLIKISHLTNCRFNQVFSAVNTVTTATIHLQRGLNGFLHLFYCVAVLLTFLYIFLIGISPPSL